MLKLKLLGNATLQEEKQSLSGRAVQPRRLALLALLALSPRKSLARDKLLAYLWPESDTEQGRHLLSVAVYELRKAMGETAIITARDDVSLSADLAIDVDEFEAAIGAGDYESALELYAGPLLDGFHINDAPDFERWADAERSHLARRYGEALEKAAQKQADQGDLAGAVTAWRRLVLHEPFNARVACGLMLALEAAGDRAGALQQARAHASLLREEFGAEPDPEVEALASRLKHEPREAAVAARHVSRVAPTTRDVGSAADAVASVKQPARMAAISVAAVAVLIVFGLWRARAQAVLAGAAPALPTIAVLPFDNLSPADTSGFFSDGLSEEIINALSRVQNLRIVARNSAFVFRDHVDVRDIAHRLGVDHVLEGTVRMAGDRIKVTARLISAQDGIEVWSDEYDRPLEMPNLISIQEDIAQAVVTALSQRFKQDPQQGPLMGSSTNDVQAFEFFVTGLHFYHRRTVPDLQIALNYFEKAIAKDPEYALAHASKAEVFALLGAYDYGALPPKTAFAAARAAARRALSIDPNLAEAHNALASTLFNYDWNLEAAEAEFRRAIQLSPGYANAHHWYSLLLHCAGRKDEAFKEIMRAQELDPLSSVIGTGVARHFYFARQPERAVKAYLHAVAIDSVFVTARVGLGLSYAASGQYDAAIRQYEEAARLLGMRIPLLDALTANALGRANRMEEATKYLERVEAAAGARYLPPEYLAAAHIGMGNLDAAFASLDQAVANRSAGVVYLAIEPIVDPIRNDPRLARLLQKIRDSRL